MVRNVEIAESVNGQRPWVAENVAIRPRFDWREPPTIALGASSAPLSQYYIHHGVCERITNSEDTMVVRIGQPQELSVADGRNAINAISQRDMVVHSEYREGGFALPYRVDWHRVIGQRELVDIQEMDTLESQNPQAARIVYFDSPAAI